MCGGEIIYSTRVKADGGFSTASPEYSTVPKQMNNEIQRAGSEHRMLHETPHHFLVCLSLHLERGFSRAKWFPLFIYFLYSQHTSECARDSVTGASG